MIYFYKNNIKQPDLNILSLEKGVRYLFRYKDPMIIKEFSVLEFFDQDELISIKVIGTDNEIQWMSKEYMNLKIGEIFVLEDKLKIEEAKIIQLLPITG